MRRRSMHVTPTDDACRPSVETPLPIGSTRLVNTNRVVPVDARPSFSEPSFSEPHASEDAAARSLVPAVVGAPCPRTVEAWRAWLGALACDAEAALAAAMAYDQLDAEGREAWLESLAYDIKELGVPKIAVYAPLLSVECDAARRQRIRAAIGAEQLDVPSRSSQALIGMGPRRLKVAVLISPLYMDFVQVLACGHRVGEEFEWVRHDPIVSSAGAVHSGTLVAGVTVEATPLKGVVDELALTVVAHRRKHGDLPAALRAFAHVFRPVFDG